jgi:hypothetical protein
VNRFAQFVHRFDIVLETLRGGYRAEASVGVYNNACACNWASIDARNKGSCLGSLRADADGVGLGRNTLVTDIDIVTARGEVEPCVLVFILLSFLPLFWHFWLFTEVVRKIPGEVTRWANESPKGQDNG